jgi:DNA-binding PadR family transcriptional regulator
MMAQAVRRDRRLYELTEEGIRIMEEAMAAR